MALRQTKKISELPALSPASLDTTFVVGISGSTTYKISINQLTSSLDSAFATDLVTNALSGTLDGKLSTSSFNSYTASISTASLVTSINNLNAFTASVSTASLVTSISNLNTFTASQSTSSLVDRLNAIESVSGSWITESETGSFLTSLSGAISSSAQITSFGFISESVDITSLNSFTSSQYTLNTAFTNGINARLQTSSFNEYTASISTASLVTSISNLNSATSSYLTSLSGAISSSTQVIGILSSLNSVSASLISKTGSYATTGSNTFYGNQLFQGSAFTNLNIGDTYGGGIVFYVSPTLSLIAQTSDLGGSYGRGSARPTGSVLGDGLSNTNQAINQYPAETYTAFYVASTNTSNGYTDWYLPSTLELITLIGQIGGLGGGWYITSTGDREVRGSDGLEVGNATNNGSVRLIRQIYTNEKPSDNNNTNISITGSLSVSGSITGSTNFNTIVNKPTLISGSAQITSLGFVSGSYLTSLNGAISSSSQLTSSFDTRYALSASFVSSSNLSSIQTITSASYAALTPVSGTLYIIIG